MKMKTDNQLKQDVNAELKWEPSIHAAEIGVEVKEGIVTLSGHVSSYTEKLNAERAAQRVLGVQAIAVELDVKLPGESKRDDADIARTAKNVLDWVSIIPLESVKVLVEDGWITLSGELDWQYQRVAAKSAVRYLMGVKGVSNQILIRPQVSPRVVKSEIEAALIRSALADGKNIQVKVNGADVTLTGKVHNHSERDIARLSAWNSPGVQSVVDNMIVTI
jgi:osmotically-inducible protein OsmY